MVSITAKKYSEKDSELAANALENVKCREGVCLSTGDKIGTVKSGLNAVLERLAVLEG